MRCVCPPADLVGDGMKVADEVTTGQARAQRGKEHVICVREIL